MQSCGIDFGTTNSSLAIVRGNLPFVVPIDQHSPMPETLRSLIYVTPDHEFFFGQDAINKYISDLNKYPSTIPQMVSTGRKLKLIKDTSGTGGFAGMKLVDELVEVDTSGRGRLIQSFKSTLANKTFAGTDIFGKFYAPEDVLGLLLKKIKERGEEYLNKTLTHAVIGRPVVYVNSSDEALALKRMETVVKIAGFSDYKLEYEPVGAALAYGLDLNTPQTVLVFDFGGGTLDLCLVQFPENKILGVSGLPLGGDILTKHLFDSYLAKHFGSQTLLGPQHLPMPNTYVKNLTTWHTLSLLKTIQNLESLDYFYHQADKPDTIKNLKSLIVNDLGFDLFSALEKTKAKLSDNDEVDFLFDRKDIDLSVTIDQQGYNKSIEEDIERTRQTIVDFLHDLSFDKNRIDKILLTGGSSKTPAFKVMLENLFGKEKLHTSNLFTSVVSGLALKAQDIFS